VPAMPKGRAGITDFPGGTISLKILANFHVSSLNRPYMCAYIANKQIPEKYKTL